MNESRNTDITQKPIVLIGMPGVGKTTLGRGLAIRLRRDFIDSDHIVAERAGMSVADIFEYFGEAKFRQAEHNAIVEQINRREPIVLATGGGAFMNADTRAHVRDNALSVWLDMPVETIIANISNTETRPLLQTENPAKTLGLLLEKRKHDYAQCDIHFEITQNTVEEAVTALLKRITTYTS